MLAAGVGVIPDDLAQIVDAVGKGAVGAKGNVDGGVSAAAVKKAMPDAVGVTVSPDDLAGRVDGHRPGAPAARQGIVERDVHAAAIEEAVAGSVGVITEDRIRPDDLAQIV